MYGLSPWEFGLPSLRVVMIVTASRNVFASSRGAAVSPSELRRGSLHPLSLGVFSVPLQNKKSQRIDISTLNSLPPLAPVFLRVANPVLLL